MSDPYAGSAPSGPAPYGPAPYGSAPYAVVPRPPAEPSTGAGWTVVALLSWWPFGLAAYPHTQRATVALASGDREGARAEGAKARRIGIVGLVYGIVVSVVLMIAVLVGTVGLAVSMIDAPGPARLESATSYAADDEPGSGPADGTPVWDLREGDCYLTAGLDDVVRTVAVVPCAERHGGELYDLAYVPGDAFAPTDNLTEPAFPGPVPLDRYAEDACIAAFETATGTPARQSGLHFWHRAPDPWDWRSLDRRITCFAESDADDLTGRLSDR
jgi:hypothetical protein